MIEPQNTMLPFATESSPTGLPQGDVGFGEMLAQTLGMAPELNAGAFAPILPDQGHDDQAGGLAQDADTEPKQSASEDTVRFQRTPPAQVPVTRQFSLPRPVDGDSVVTDPIYGDDEGAERTPVQPGSEHPLPVVGEPELSPAIGLEQPPVVGAGRPPTLGSSVTSPVVDPVVDQPPMHRLDAGASRPSPVAEELVPVEPDPVRRSPIDRPQPPTGAMVMQPEQAQVTSGSQAGDQPAPTEPGAATPVDRVDQLPVRGADARLVEAVPTRPGSEPPVDQVSPEVDVLRPKVPNNDAAIHLQTTGVRMADRSRVVVPDGKIEIQSSSSAVPLSSVEGSVAQPAAVSNMTQQTVPVQHSALAERVLEAVELQANQPPPRTMIVDIPEIEGLRLVVSVRSGAEVHVVQSSASTTTDGLQGFLTELEGVLEGRGFVMTGDHRRRGGNRQQEELPDQPRRPRPTFNRPTDNDLRI